MKLDLNSKEDRDWVQVYTCRCDHCKKLHTIRSQKDGEPEYHTDVYLLCDCGEWLKFKLPVN